jgi:crotonobetainyl-CoA:carnitine CoA-transferase CaiB-like acyl-CoA transferase
MSGLMSITGEGPGRQPVKSGAPVTDITAGILAAMGVLAAYVHRLKTGAGQMVDTSLFEAGITHTYWQSAIALATGIAPGPMGSAHPLNGPYQAFKASDGWLTVGASNQSNWLRMLDAMELRALADDPRFADNAARMKHLDALAAVLAARFAEHDTAEWLRRFAEVGVPAGPVLDIKQMHQDPQTKAREMLVEVEHRKAGKVKAIGLPVKFSATPGKVGHAAPILGEHSRAILAEHGYSDNEIQALAAERAVLLGT